MQKNNQLKAVELKRELDERGEDITGLKTAVQIRLR